MENKIWSRKELIERILRLEKRDIEDTITLVEILSNITFFGSVKMENCSYAREGQCQFFILERAAKGKIPMAMDCRLKDCEDKTSHLHLELSNMICAFCPVTSIERQNRETNRSIKLSLPY